MKNLLFILFLFYGFSSFAQTYQLKYGDGSKKEDFERKVYLKKISSNQYYFYISSSSATYVTEDFAKITFKDNKAEFSPNPFGKFTLTIKPNLLIVLFMPHANSTEPKMRQYSGLYKLTGSNVPTIINSITGSKFKFEDKTLKSFYQD